MTSRVRLRSYLGNSAMSWRERDDPAASVSYIQMQLPLCDELKRFLLSSNARSIILYQISVFLSAVEKRKMPSFFIVYAFHTNTAGALGLMPLAEFASQERPYAINEKPLMSRIRMQEV